MDMLCCDSVHTQLFQSVDFSCKGTVCAVRVVIVDRPTLVHQCFAGLSRTAKHFDGYVSGISKTSPGTSEKNATESTVAQSTELYVLLVQFLHVGDCIGMITGSKRNKSILITVATIPYRPWHIERTNGRR